MPSLIKTSTNWDDLPLDCFCERLLRTCSGHRDDAIVDVCFDGK